MQPNHIVLMTILMLLVRTCLNSVNIFLLVIKCVPLCVLCFHAASDLISLDEPASSSVAPAEQQLVSQMDQLLLSSQPKPQQ